MATAVVKLTEKIIKADANNVVTEMNIVLELTGKGDTKLTADKQKGSIEFFSQEKAGATPEKIATLETYGCWIEEDTSKKPTKKVARFDIDSASMDNVLDDSETDFKVNLIFNLVNFKSDATKPDPGTKMMHLPWKTPNLKLSPKLISDHFRIGARFLVEGAEESKAYLDTGDIPTKHSKVKNDPDVVPTGEAAMEFTAVGVTNVHLTGLSVQNRPFPPPANRKIPVGSDPLHIILHPDVQTRLETLKSGSFDLAKLTANLRSIFANAFTNITVEALPAGDAKLGVWKVFSKDLYSTGVADPANALVNEGHLVPFFDFWIFASDKSASGEIAHAEMLAAPSHWYDAATKNKRIQQPTVIPSSSSSTFATHYKALPDTDQRMIFAAIVIGHEVGHCLGLGHCRNAETGYPTSGNSIALMSNPSTLNGEYRLSKLGTVSAELLKDHYT